MACSSQDSFAYIESLQHPTIAILLIKILISFRPLSSVHLLRSNQHFQAIEFVDRHVSDKLASITQRFLVPVSTVSARNAWHNDPRSVTQTRQKSQGGTSRKIGWGCAARFLKPLPYFRPKSVIFSTLFQTWSKIWYPVLDLKPWRVNGARDTLLWHVHDSWRKHQMVLSPNYEEVANSSKKTYPIQD